MDKFLAWYFCTDANPFRYGVTVWAGSCDRTSTKSRSRDYESAGFTVENIRFDLLTAESGFVSRDNAVKLIDEFTRAQVCDGDNVEILVDDLPHVKTLVKLAKLPYSVKPVARQGDLVEQALEFGSMLNRDRFYLPEGVLVESDLIFPDNASENLIDPIFSDEQTAFPQSEALLIACSGLQDHYKGSSIAFSTLGRRSLFSELSAYSDHSSYSAYSDRSNYSGY